MYKHKNGIIFNKLEKSDLFLLKELKNESWYGTHNVTFLNDEDQLKWFNNLNSSTLILIATLNDNKIGVYKIQNIDWVNRRYDSGHDIFKDHRGNGYSKLLVEAGVDFGFEMLNMQRIETEVLENNIASMKPTLYAGFIREGIKRKCIYKCDTYLDSVFLGILREDWKKLDRVIKYDGICNLSYTPKNGINYEK
jgi:RimJ/RimL family protein N-acetyltransferase